MPEIAKLDLIRGLLFIVVMSKVTRVDTLL